MEYNKQDYINYRLKRATESVDDARVLIKTKSWIAGMNRLYYAAFYAVNALLFSKDINVKIHNGVRRMFDLHFVKTGIVSKESGKFYSNLLNLRGEGDYMEFIEFDEDIVIPFQTI